MDSIRSFQGPGQIQPKGQVSSTKAPGAPADPSESLTLTGGTTTPQTIQFRSLMRSTPERPISLRESSQNTSSAVATSLTGGPGFVITNLPAPELKATAPAKQQNAKEQVRDWAAKDFVSNPDGTTSRFMAAGLREIQRVKPDLSADHIYAGSNLVESGRNAPEKLARLDTLVQICRANPDVTADQIDSVSSFANNARTPAESGLRLWGSKRMFELNPKIGSDVFDAATRYVEGGPRFSDQDQRLTNVLDALRMNPNLNARQMEGFGRFMSTSPDKADQAFSWVKTAPTAFQYA